MAEGKENAHTVGEWSSQVYRLSDFLEFFQLPQVVKVHEGYHDEKDEKTLSVDEILILHKYETIPKVFAINFQEEEEWGELSLPLTCAVKVDRVPQEFAKGRLSSGGILQQLSKVRFVRVAESDTEVGLVRNDKLKVKYKTVENHGTSFSFSLSTLTKPKEIFKVTQNCKATFQVVLEPNEYRIAEVVRNFGLPNYVYMVDNAIQEKFKNSYPQVQRVLKLQRTFTETYITASTLEYPSLVIKLPRDLEITLLSSLEAENQRRKHSEFCGELNNCTKIEREERLMSKRADSCFVYEDMTDHAKETEIASLQKDKMKREIKRDAAGKLQVVIPNNYTRTPLARAFSNRNGIYDFPKASSTEGAQESINSHRTPLYDIPRQGTSSQNDTDISGSLFKNQIYCQEYARMESLKSSRFSTAAEDEESEDHIYQEITFRELPEEMKTSCSIRKEALNNKDRIIPSGGRKIPSKRDSAPANLKVGELKTEPGQNSNNYQIDRTMTDKSKSTRKYQTWNAQTDSDQAVYENCNFLKTRQSESDSHFEVYKQNDKASPQRRASAGVANLVGSSLGSAISDALLKNNLFVKKADYTREKIPPQPPPRTSSRKPDIPEESECSSTGNNGTTNKKKAGQTPLPEPPKTNVRRSASAAATMTGFVKEKSKFSGRPLPIPKIKCQSKMGSKEALNEKCPSTNTSGFISTMATPEKPSRPKPLIPPKALTPVPAPIKTRFDRSEGQGSSPKDPRERKSTPLDLRKPAIIPQKPKPNGGSVSMKSETREQPAGPTARTNRSHSLNELNTEFDQTDFVIPDDLRSLGVAGVAECLKKLKLEQLVVYFQDNQIDGEMLLSLDDDILSEMGIEKFHRLKLVKFIGGWRPMM